MKKFTKKALSLILSLVLIFTTVCAVAVNVSAAAVSTPGPNLTYTLDENTGVFTVKYKGTGDGAMYDFTGSNLGSQKPPWLDKKDKIKKVVIEEGVTTVGTYSFAFCANLTEVKLPSTLKSINGAGVTGGAASSSDAFSYGAFRECTALKSITLPANLESIGNVAFRECTALTDIVIPDSVKSLGIGSFVNCTSLKSVTFSDNITEIPTECFYKCNNLLTINWGAKINKINEWAFYGTRLNSVDIPESITSIDGRAFADCYHLMEATIHNKECSIASLAFNNTQLTKPQDFTVKGHTGSTAQTFAESRGYNFISIDACPHTNTHKVISTPATCTTDGVEETVCDECQYVLSTAIITATGHTFKEGEEIVKDDTLVDGHIRTTRNCTTCHEDVLELQHAKKPVESDGDTSTNIGGALEDANLNNYIWVDGYYTYENTATCTKSGRETYTCTVEGCGTTVLGRFVPTSEYHIVQKGDHNVAAWTTSKQPTCTEAGEKKGKCSICEETVTEAIEPTGHSYDKEKPVRSINKTDTDGHIYTYFLCDNCQKEVCELTHVEWIELQYTPNIITNATCTIDGVERDTCDICGEKRTISIPANGEHVWYETSVQEPDCTHQGQTNYACENCKLTKADRTPALGHDYQKVGSQSIDPTCTEAGYDTFKCSRCPASYQDTLAALGHYPTDESYTVIKEPDCENAGVYSGICVDCGVKFESEIEALGHNMKDIRVTVEGKPGHMLVTPTCARCNKTEPATLEHIEWIEGYYDRTVITEPTCVTGEVSRDKCTICNETRNNNEGAPLGHEYKFASIKYPSSIDIGDIGDSESGSGLGGLIGNINKNDESGSGIGGNLGDLGNLGNLGNLGDLDLDKYNIEDYSIIYTCKHCSLIGYKHVKDVWGYWDNYFYNTEVDGRVNVNNSSYLDVTGDNFINAKDYVKLRNLYNEYLQAEAEKTE